MPTISIVIPAYNKASYLSDCLARLGNQTFPDLEIIVVDDCSTDTTRDMVREHMQRDHRIILVEQDHNQGTLVARKTGALRSHGEFVTFMDQDDELVPEACENMLMEMRRKPVDILHFGVHVDAANALAEDAARGMAEYMTPRPRSLYGSQILETAFRNDGYDWNMHHKLYRGDLLRRSLADLEDTRLTRPDDAYLYFAVASNASSYRAVPDSPWYIYHLGRGVTLGETLTVKTFDDISAQDAKALELVRGYVEHHGNTTAQGQALQGLQVKLIEHTMNEWKDNIDATHKEEAFHVVRRYWSDVDIAGEMYRFVNDDAFRAMQHIDDEECHRFIADIDFYRKLIGELALRDTDHLTCRRLYLMKERADGQLAALQRARHDKRLQDDSPIRIFVSTHKDVDHPDSVILQPVQVGSTNAPHRFPGVFHDDTGDNISSDNPRYCELTTQYWAWKNIDAEYYGFCHYRRYFDFTDAEHPENDFGEILDDYIDASAAKEYGLDDATITKAVTGYDVITTRFGNLRNIINGAGTPRAVWEQADKLHDEDLRLCYRILCTMHPDYKADADAFLNGNTSCFCNMFIMKKAVFFDYCDWLFPILRAFDDHTNMATYSKEALRTPGHLAERLLNIYLLHQQRVGTRLRMKQLQCVHFTNPEREEPLRPLSTVADAKSIVPVVFAADDNYVPQLTTTIYSAMKNASRNRHYDVVVLQRNIAWDKQERLRDFFSSFPNMTLRFTNVDRMVSGYQLTTNNQHISVETYYRFLIQSILPFYDKVLYLDSDIIVSGDIAELYDTQLGDNLLAAVHDIDFLGNLNVKHGKRMQYAKTVLGMKHPYDYFQAGVLLLNTAAMRKRYTIAQWLRYASDDRLIYNDQDVLNVHCAGKVMYLPWEWNVVHDCANRVANVFSYAPNDVFDAYLASRNNPRIIHYAGFVKPWTDPDCDFASIYWRYARETPFYERLLKRVALNGSPQNSLPASARHERAVGVRNPIRKLVDPIAPIGSNRRELMKAVIRMARGKK